MSKAIEFDILTNETIERELTKEELLECKEAIKEYTAIELKREAKIEAKAIAKAAIADRLGLTADELQVLLG